MKIKEKRLKGVFEITFAPFKDERGFFMRVYDEKIMKQANLHRNWVQENHSRSIKKGIIRGLHFQFPPYTETKLIRAVRGAVFDVFVDLRKDSPTFGEWDSIELSEGNKKCVFIPRGFAHGFCTLTDNCEVTYKVDNWYAPDYEGGIIWNDKDLAIDWPEDDPVLSDKDKELPSYKEFIRKKGAIDLNEMEKET